MKKVILHVDVDSFFVNAEIIDKPHLKDKDIVISTSRASSIALSISYSLKNKGCFVPEKIDKIEKLSSELYIFKPNHDLYYELSKKIFFLLKKYTQKIEIYSIDEWFLDVTHMIEKYGSVKKLTQIIQDDILKSFNLPISIGVSYNIFLAKMANYLAKPFGIFLIKNKDDIEKFLWPLKIERYFGIGKQKINNLYKIKIETIGDLANANKNDKNLNKIFKNLTSVFIDNANGIGNDIINYKNELSKSISKSKVIKEGSTNNEEKILHEIYSLSFELSLILLERNDIAKTLLLKFYSPERVIDLKEKNDNYFQSFESIFTCCKNLFLSEWNDEYIYKIDIKLINIIDISLFMKQSNIFDKQKDNSIVHNIINNINNNLGKKELVILSEKKPKKDSKQLKIHSQ
ncbi:MAG: hypothetical protein ACRDAW_01545 [Metamycoplasmataceae bacterium]